MGGFEPSSSDLDALFVRHAFKILRFQHQADFVAGLVA